MFDVQLVNRVSVAGKQHRACAAVSQQGEARRGAGVAKLERENGTGSAACANGSSGWDFCAENEPAISRPPDGEGA